jgi:hypothetical protein
MFGVTAWNMVKYPDAVSIVRWKEPREAENSPLKSPLLPAFHDREREMAVNSQDFLSGGRPKLALVTYAYISESRTRILQSDLAYHA